MRHKQALFRVSPTYAEFLTRDIYITAVDQVRNGDTRALARVTTASAQTLMAKLALDVARAKSAPAPGDDDDARAHQADLR